jgi:PEP-CTERM motif-containing protein
MRILSRAALVGAAAIALGSLPALSQTVTYTTTGTFSGGGCGGAPSNCNFGNFLLTYQGGGGSFLNGSLVDLGQFSIQCTTASCPMTALPAGTTFTLTISQTSPSVGSGQVTTSTFTGSVAFNPDFSSLNWTPTQGSVTIGSTTYVLNQDIGGGYNIVGPSSSTGQNPNTSVVRATVNVTPEPSTVALMATGIFGLVPLIRRRRR